MAIGIAVERSASSRMMLGELAPEFQRQALHCVQGVLGDQFSDLRRTGESDFLNVGTLR